MNQESLGVHFSTVIFKPPLLNKSDAFSTFQDCKFLKNGKLPYMKVTTSDDIEFSGTIDQDNLEDEQFVLFVEDEDKGTMTRMSTDVFLLYPFNNIVDEGTSDDEKSNQNDPQWRETLIDEFGNIHTKKRIVESKRFNLALTPKDFKKIAKKSERTALENSMNMSGSADPNQSLLPTKNSGAQKADEIYDINTICPLDIVEHLQADATLLSNSTASDWDKWRNGDIYNEAIISRLSCLPQGEKRLHFCTLLAFFVHLHNLFKLSYKQLNRKSPLPNAPEPVSRYLLRNYTVYMDTELNKRRGAPLEFKDKQIMHLLLILLTVDGFRSPLDDLSKVFGVSISRLRKLLSLLGCSFGTHKEKATVFLRAAPTLKKEAEEGAQSPTVKRPSSSTNTGTSGKKKKSE